MLLYEHLTNGYKLLKLLFQKIILNAYLLYYNTP
nr:MAG TPA: hypothetical protein [Caudoviricetes sp.]